MTIEPPPEAEPLLPEYAGNPFIARLPPPLSATSAIEALTDLPEFEHKERLYPAHLRIHCIQRLARYFDPLSRHLALEQRVGALIRQGYIGRNPHTTDYIHRLHNNHERLMRRSLEIAPPHPVETTASGFALIGASGIGKTRSVDRILRLYRQIIPHDEPMSLTQVSWIRLECPHKGSAKQLCISFFNEMDRLLGTRFQARHGSGRIALDEMVVHMAQIADRHALGLLVIDEIQHLTQAPGASKEDLLNFLVTLINKIGLPVMIVGTPAALPLLQGAFRQARRASGLGSAFWPPMAKDIDWFDFVKRMWRFQWTQETTLLDDEIRDALTDESQGVVDVVIKLYMLTQLHAIQLGVTTGRPETIDAGLIRHVAKTDLTLIAPMIDALRRGDQRALQRYDDLRPLDDFVCQILSDASARFGGRIAPPEVISASASGNLDDQALLGVLEDMGVASDIAALLLAEIRAVMPDAGPLDLIGEIRDRLRGRGPEAKPTKRKRKAPPMVDPLAEDPQDLRKVLAAKPPDAYAAFREAGWIRSPCDDAA